MKLFLAALLLIVSLPVQAEAPKRIVSVGGAQTEILYALGAGDLLVGSDTTSYYPPEANQMPKVGYQRALSAEGILSLEPDLVILNEDAGPPPVIHQLEGAGVALLHVQASHSLDDIKTNIKVIGEAIGKADAATALIAEMEADAETLKQTIAQAGNSKRVMFVMSHGGGAPKVAGTNTAADGIIALSGGFNVVTNFEGYKPLTPESAVALKPDVILVTTRGLKQSGGKEGLLKAPGIGLTPAGKAGHVIAMDPLLLLGFGPRSVQAARELNEHYQAL